MNDNFPGLPLSGSPVATTGTNVQATAQAGEPDPANSSGATSVWWSWTPSLSGTYAINTNGSSFDTTLGVYTGSVVTALTLVTDNDDGWAGLTSEVAFNATAGTIYRIQVNGFLGAANAISLNIVGPIPGSVVWGTPPPSTLPAGSSVSVSWTVSGGSTEYTSVYGDTVNPPFAFDATSFQFGPAGTYTDTLIAPVDGGTYYLQAHARISGADFRSGVVTVTVPPPPPPVNDAFPGNLLVGLPVIAAGTNIGATAQAGEPNPAGTSGPRSVWWSWTAPSTGSVTITTSGSNFDTTLGVYTGSSPAALILVAEDDDGPTVFTSELSFAASAGVTYQIQVNGFSTRAGSIALNLSSTPISTRGKGGGGGGGCGSVGLDALFPLLLLLGSRRGLRQLRGRSPRY